MICWPSPLFQGHPPLTPPPWQLLRLRARPAACRTLRTDQRFDTPKTPPLVRCCGSLCLSCTAAAAALSSSRLAARSTTRRQQYGNIGSNDAGSSPSRPVLRTLPRQRSRISPDCLVSRFSRQPASLPPSSMCAADAGTRKRRPSQRQHAPTFVAPTSGSGPHRLPTRCEPALHKRPEPQRSTTSGLSPSALQPA